MTSVRFLASLFTLVGLSCLMGEVSAFKMSRSDNLAVYWGQNSYGAAHRSDTSNTQKRLSFYCGPDSVIDTFPLAFVNVFFSKGGLPSMDLAGFCGGKFPGTNLLNCASMAEDIKACQTAGKTVTISLGGAVGEVGFESNSQARSFADTIWDIFLGGSSPTRPFGDAVLDGVDLDIEAGNPTGYAAFVNQIRARATGASKRFYITGAPQCPFPDAALGNVINAASFDAIYVQFYNNYCGLQAYHGSGGWNFHTWDDWAKTTSPNKNVKIYIGAPASRSAAGSGYVDADTFAGIIKATKRKYSSFGGVMMWDASQAYANDRYDIAIKKALRDGAPPEPESEPSTPEPTPTAVQPSESATQAPPEPSPSVGCAGAPEWSVDIAYSGQSQVVYDGHLWRSQWWSLSQTPGGEEGVWTDENACIASRFVRPARVGHASRGSGSFIASTRARASTNANNSSSGEHPKRSRVFMS